MEISQLKRSVQDIARTVGAIVEDKLGDRSQLEEQLRNLIRRATATPMVKLKFKKLPHFKGELPAYATPGSSGLDVRACLEKELILAPMERVLIPTGLSMELPLGYEIQARPRSGLAIKKGLSLVNTPGTIDADYRGEIQIIVINLGSEAITIQDQDRIAQLVVCPIVQAEIELEEELSGTDRGEGGFGSTGV